MQDTRTVPAVGLAARAALNMPGLRDRLGLRGSLFRKYAVYLVALVSTALLMSGGVGVYFTYQENKAARLNMQRENAAAAADAIETYIGNVEHQLKWMGLAQLSRADCAQRKLEYRKLLEQEAAIVELRYLDAIGRQRLKMSRLDLDDCESMPDFSSAAEFTQAGADRVFYSPVYFEKTSDSDHKRAFVTMSIRGSSGVDGVTVAKVDLGFTNKVIANIARRSGGVAYVVASGTIVAHSSMHTLRTTDFSQLEHVKSAQRVGRPADVMIEDDVDGNAALIAYATPDTPLHLHVFFEQPLAQAFAALHTSLERAGLILLAGLALALGMSLLLARHMVTPIRAIQSGAARIAAGKLDQTIHVHTGDELEGLAREFNDMAKQLQESYGSLERKVQERTLDLRESLEQQTATSEVLKTIGRSSYDLAAVLSELIASATKLGHADAGAVYLAQQEGRFELRAAHSEHPELLGWMQSSFRDIDANGSGVAAQAIRGFQAVELEDAHIEPDPRRTDLALHTALAVPIVRAGAPVGLLMVLRRRKERFSDKQKALIATFADQAGIAAENARLFNEIQSKSRELELANKHKSEFLANVSHELRTPLNAIIGFSEVLGERMFGDLNAKQAEYVDDIHGSGKHLLALINDILNLAKIEAGRMDLELSRFSLKDALQSSLGVIRERASRHGVELSLELQPQLGELVADERKFKQIMLNLLSNAVKFTPEGGKVSVRAARQHRFVEVVVADTGVGIAAGQLDVIFDEFRQVGRHDARNAEGTGLGLALTKRYVELHGGRIHVKSQEGAGSTFTFTMPAGEAEPV